MRHNEVGHILSVMTVTRLLIQLSNTKMTESPRRNLSSVRFLVGSQGVINLHLANESIFVDRLPTLGLRLLCPHLLHIFQNHVEVSVERFHPG